MSTLRASCLLCVLAVAGCGNSNRDIFGSNGAAGSAQGGAGGDDASAGGASGSEAGGSGGSVSSGGKGGAGVGGGAAGGTAGSGGTPGPCSDGEKRCNGDVPQLCAGQQWQDQSPCTGDGTYCSAGGCAFCPAGFANCNMNSADGCETSLDTMDACGGCGQACSAPSDPCQVVTCEQGQCKQHASAEGTVCGPAPGACAGTPKCQGGKCTPQPKADGTNCGTSNLDYCLGGECKGAQYVCMDKSPNGYTIYTQDPLFGKTVSPCPSQGAGSGSCKCDGQNFVSSGSGYECVSTTQACSACVSVGATRICWL